MVFRVFPISNLTYQPGGSITNGEVMWVSALIIGPIGACFNRCDADNMDFSDGCRCVLSPCYNPGSRGVDGNRSRNFVVNPETVNIHDLKDMILKT